ncbi:hypothetical protein PAXRUDRAFT_28975 [Paxillus rubicundulus Ve08.2h10]|uniref:Uncharacterized protein n=1 Tax=Paxillus rubicundulus Ve08.2h10 TaxID=930991 RepID=A0A0D0BZ22_9AGAM|nr:hypothetical protein PAXRUDRAFT_28975 [Paxillus rubicundulus Ve08.2h10]
MVETLKVMLRPLQLCILLICDESDYSNGKGIQVLVNFTLLPKPSAAVLDMILDAYSQSDHLHYTIANRSGLLAPWNFSVKYPILQTAYKDVAIENKFDFTTIVKEVIGQHAPSFKLTIAEFKVGLLLTLTIQARTIKVDSFISQLPTGDEENDAEPEEEEPKENTAQAKKKNPGLTPLEQEINEMIEELVDKYKCKDNSHKSNTCWPAPPDTKHLQLTPLHLKTWTATMLSHTYLEDVSMLACCHLGNIMQNQSSAPQIVINNNFKDLTGILWGDHMNPKIPNPPLPHHDPAKLSAALKLDIMKITGPHGLHFISNTDLCEIGKLNIGKLADVHDAQEQWTLGQGMDAVPIRNH